MKYKCSMGPADCRCGSLMRVAPFCLAASCACPYCARFDHHGGWDNCPNAPWTARLRRFAAERASKPDQAKEKAA